MFSSSWSSPLHMSGSWSRSNMRWEFCMQTYRRSGPRWPRGTYCIFSKYSCPSGFRRGSLYFDDEDRANQNRHSGIMPDGTYGSNTRYYFCCRCDRSTSSRMTLPTQKPFILFQYRGRRCQSVNGMRVREEWFYWDCEDNANANSYQSPHPRQTGGRRNMKIHMCYYYSKKYSLISSRLWYIFGFPLFDTMLCFSKGQKALWYCCISKYFL